MNLMYFPYNYILENKFITLIYNYDCSYNIFSSNFMCLELLVIIH